LAFTCSVLLIALLAAPTIAQGERGKADLKAGSGLITLDYGRPSLKGRDMLSKLAVGAYWRLGSDDVTLLTTPVDLAFGAAKLAKGSYSLWLKRTAEENYELVFNNQTTGHGMNHDAARDVAGVSMRKTTLPNPVETLSLELEPAPNGGTFTLGWGMTKLATSFQFGK
jgi:hypothetical protein